MKNKIKYFLIFLVFLYTAISLFTNIDLIATGQRIIFGSSYWKDSLANGISTNKSIYLQSGDSLYYNGHTVTSGSGGGGIAASDNLKFSGRDSTTERWVFSDSVYNRYYTRIDSLFTKNITPDDNKGLVWTNTSSVKSVSGALYYSGGSHNFNTPYNTNVALIDSINGLTLVSGNLIPGSGNGILWDATHKITYSSPTTTLRGNYWTYKSAVSNSTILQIDSIIGMQLYMGTYIGNGSGLTTLSASNISSGTLDKARYDTAAFARVDTLITENVKGVWNFWNVVRFIGAVTFDVSPVFNSVVNFANGVSVTGNASITGYTTLGDSTGSIPLKYCLVRGKIGANTNVNYNFALPQHLTGNGFKRVVSWTCNVRNDSAAVSQKKNIAPNSWYNNYAYYASIDSVNCVVGLTATNNLVNDSVFFCIWYRSE